jgi:hypothetical protein
MSAKSKYQGLGDAWQALKAQHAAGKAEPTAAPEFLTVGKIKRWPEVFQHRTFIQAQSDSHVMNLAKAAAHGDLEPVTVWWDGKKWACIDGHHRLQAYVKAGKYAEPVPVKVFSGTPEEAFTQAARGNTPDKLQMTKAEKMETAWRLVTTAGLTKAEEVKASGVSDGQVGHMRRVRHQLEALAVDCKALKWHQARDRAAGKDGSTSWTPEQAEEQVQAMVQKLAKTFGRLQWHQVDLFARAVYEYDTRAYEALRQERAEHPED